MKRLIIVFSAVVAGLAAHGQELRLRGCYSDHMLFQRDQPIVFAGTGDVGEVVKIEMNGVTASAKADAKGGWRVELPPMKAGGPYVVAVTGSRKALKLADVMVGELWFASGQSNMEMPVCGSRWFSLTNGEAVAAAANDSGLRLLNIPHSVDCDEVHNDILGSPVWYRADAPEGVRPFSATGYYFGLELRRRLKVPVGIIAADWGGTRIEPWIPEATLKAHDLKKALADLDLARNPTNAPESILEYRARRTRELSEWIARVESAEGSLSAVAKSEWMKPGIGMDGWMPGTLDIDNPAFVWFRWEIDVPATDGEVSLDMDFASDTDEAWFDGRSIGRTGIDVPYYWSAKRHYSIGKVAAGRHLVVIRVENHFAAGGIGKPRLTWSGGMVELSRQAPLVRIETAPNAKTGARPCCPWDGCPGDGMVRGSNIVPSSIYNGMVAPLDVFRCRGTIWYQGCANAGEWQLYHGYQKALVDGFRKTFSRPDMAFVCVQLAGFIEQRPEHRLNDAEVAAREPTETGFSMIRGEQVRIREIPGCDCATAFDIGDHSDVHPKNKKEVGRRLAGLAEALCYCGTEKARGPQVVKAERKGTAVEVTFDEPLVVDPSAMGTTFALAGTDGHRVWAAAKLVSPNTVRIESEKVLEPVLVDYCHAPFVFKGAVFNRDGYPLLPFRRTLGE